MKLKYSGLNQAVPITDRSRTGDRPQLPTVPTSSFDVYRIKGDGDCFYSSVEKVYRDSGINVANGELRARLTQYIDDNSHQLAQLDVVQEAGGVANLRKTIAGSGQWDSNAGDLVGAFAAQTLGREIHVLQPNRNNSLQYSQISVFPAHNRDLPGPDKSSSGGAEQAPIYLLHTNSSSKLAHYDLLQTRSPQSSLVNSPGSQPSSSSGNASLIKESEAYAPFIEDELLPETSLKEASPKRLKDALAHLEILFDCYEDAVTRVHSGKEISTKSYHMLANSNDTVAQAKTKKHEIEDRLSGNSHKRFGIRPRQGRGRQEALKAINLVAGRIGVELQQRNQQGVGGSSASDQQSTDLLERLSKKFRQPNCKHDAKRLEADLSALPAVIAPSSPPVTGRRVPWAADVLAPASPVADDHPVMNATKRYNPFIETELLRGETLQTASQEQFGDGVKRFAELVDLYSASTRKIDFENDKSNRLKDKELLNNLQHTKQSIENSLGDNTVKGTGARLSDERQRALKDMHLIHSRLKLELAKSQGNASHDPAMAEESRELLAAISEKLDAPSFKFSADKLNSDIIKQLVPRKEEAEGRALVIKQSNVNNASVTPTQKKLQTKNDLSLPYPLAGIPVEESCHLPQADMDKLHREVGLLFVGGEEKRAKDHFKDFMKKTLYLSKKDVAGLTELFVNRDFYHMHDHYEQAKHLEESHGKATTVATQSNRVWSGIGATVASVAGTAAVVSGGVAIPVSAVLLAAGGLMGAYGFVINEMGRVFGDSNSIMRKMEDVWLQRIDNLNSEFELGLDEEAVKARAREISIKGVEYHVRKAWLGRGSAAAAGIVNESAVNGTAVTIGLASAATTETGSATVSAMVSTGLVTGGTGIIRLPAGILSAMGSRLAYMDASTALAIMKSGMQGGAALTEDPNQSTAAAISLAADIDETLRHMLAKQLNDEIFKELGVNKCMKADDMLKKPTKTVAAKHDATANIQRAAKKIATSRDQLTGADSSASHNVKIVSFANKTSRLRYELNLLKSLQGTEDLKAGIEQAEENHLRMFDVLQDKLIADRIISRRITHEEMATSKKHLVAKFARAYEAFDSKRLDEPLKDVHAVRVFNKSVLDILKQFDEIKEDIAGDPAAHPLTKVRRKLLGPTRSDVQNAIINKGATPIRSNNAVLVAKEAELLSKEKEKSAESFMWRPSGIELKQKALKLNYLLPGGADRPAKLLRAFAPPVNADSNPIQLTKPRPISVADIFKYRTRELPIRKDISQLESKIKRVEVSESAKLFGQATQRVLSNKWGDNSDLALRYRETFLSNKRAQSKAGNYERHRVRNSREHRYDRWKFDAHKLRTAIESHIREPGKPLTVQSLDDITKSPKLRDLTRRILATHKHSKVDSIAERWAWNRHSFSDRTQTWNKIPDEMISDVLDDMLQTMVNSQAEHVGRLTDPLEKNESRLVSQGIHSSSINSDQRELILRSAQLGYRVKDIYKKLDKANYDNEHVEAARMANEYNRLIDELGDVSKALIEQKGQFTQPSKPKLTYFTERAVEIQNIVKSKHLAPVSSETADADLSRYITAFKSHDQRSMENLAAMIKRPEFIEFTAERYGKDSPKIWNESMDKVRDYQRQLELASQQSPEALKEVQEVVSKAGSEAAMEYIDAQDQIYRATIQIKNGRRDDGKTTLNMANERMAQAVPFLLLDMQSKTENYQVLKGTLDIQQERIDAARNAFDDFIVPFSAGDQPTPLSYRASDFMERVRESYESSPAFTHYSDDEIDTWKGFFESKDPHAHVKKADDASPGVNTSLLSIMHAVANAESQRLTLGGDHRPDHSSLTHNTSSVTNASSLSSEITETEIQRRRAAALDALKQFSRATANGDKTASVDYNSSDFVERAREAIADHFTHLKPQHFEKYAKVDTSTFATGQYQQAAKDFNRVLGKKTQSLLKTPDLKKLETIVLVADNIRKKGPLKAKHKLLQPNTRITWRDHQN